MEKRHRKPAKTTKSEQRKIEVEFDYESMEEKEVFLAGDQYHFIMDGDWQNDPFACGYAWDHRQRRGQSLSAGQFAARQGDFRYNRRTEYPDFA